MAIHVVPGLVASRWFDSLVGKGEYNYVDSYGAESSDCPMTTNVQSMAYLMTETNNCVMTQKTGLK